MAEKKTAMKMKLRMKVSKIDKLLTKRDETKCWLMQTVYVCMCVIT